MLATGAWLDPMSHHLLCMYGAHLTYAVQTQHDCPDIRARRQSRGAPVTMSAANASPACELMNAASAHIANADSTSGTTTCHRRSAAAHMQRCVMTAVLLRTGIE